MTKQGTMVLLPSLKISFIRLSLASLLILGRDILILYKELKDSELRITSSTGLVNSCAVSLICTSVGSSE